MKEFRAAILTLADAGVDFIIVGGVAGSLHGAARATYDLDVVYGRTPANLERLCAALADKHPYLRGAPPGLPFTLDAPTLKRGLNFTLQTDIGDLDLLGEIAGGGTYDELLPHSRDVEIEGRNCRLLDLATLIAVKRAAGRAKDFDAIAELEALLEERDATEPDANR
jgi:predicted nucleotidyltransferase